MKNYICDCFLYALGYVSSVGYLIFVSLSVAHIRVYKPSGPQLGWLRTVLDRADNPLCIVRPDVAAA